MLHTTKRNQVEFISSPKYISKDAKFPIESKKLHATTNNSISKSLPILVLYSSIELFTPLGSIPYLYLEY